MKIAIIGSGISGLTSAWLLNKQHDVSVFESNERIGGHTATIDIEHTGNAYAIDTGFIVYNEWTYPNFIRLMNELGVSSQKTQMSFSVHCPTSKLEYSGSNLNTLFSQRKNIFKPSFIRMLLQIMRFNKESIIDLNNGTLSEGLSLGDYLTKNNYNSAFINDYLIPMGSAIWSSSTKKIFDLPALFFITFFKNHGLLSIKNRPQWRVIKGGSKQYLEPLTSTFNDKITTNANINSIERSSDQVTINFYNGERKTFDHVVFACHSDQALDLLSKPSADELRILKALPYQNNQVTLHTDTQLLPKNNNAWASWNYRLGSDAQELPILSYNMNILQGIESKDTFVVSLNADHIIDKNKVIKQFNYAHPIFTIDGINAQNQWEKISGVNNTSYCGAYWGSGFHEDGCTSGIRVANALGVQW